MRMKPVMRGCAAFVLAAASLSLIGQGPNKARNGNGDGGARSGGQNGGDVNYRGVSDPMASNSMTLLRCTSGDGSSSCTAEQVAGLNRGIVSSRKQRKPLAMVQDLDLEPNGWLKCSQMDGSACTNEQLSEVIAVSAEVQGRSETFRLSRQVDVATR
jgi:hypothetical protein